MDSAYVAGFYNPLRGCAEPIFPVFHHSNGSIVSACIFRWKGWLMMCLDRGILAVCVSTAISMLGQGIMSPVLPLFARTLGVSATVIGFVVGVFGLSRLFINVPAGLLSERIGSRRLIGSGLMLTAVGLLMTGMAGNAPAMALWRFISGAGSAMSMTGSAAFIADISTLQNRGRLMSIHQGSLLFGTSIGPGIGGFVADALGYRWPFFVAAGLAAAAALWIFSRLPETKKKKPPSPDPPPPGTCQEACEPSSLQTTATLLAIPTFFLVCLFTLVVFFTRTGSRQTLLPLLAVERAGMSATQLGLLFTVIAFINLLLVLPAGAMADRFGRKAVILPGALLAIAGLVLFACAGRVPVFFAAGILLGLGTGVIGPAPAAFAADMAPPGKAGLVMGLYRTFGDIGFIIGPILLGWISEAFSGRIEGVSGYSIAMVFNALLIGLAAVLLAVMGKETAGRRPGSRVAPGGTAMGRKGK
jgi:MFS family permease